LKHPACQSLEYIKFRNETTADIPWSKFKTLLLSPCWWIIQWVLLSS
jgi:hypothetical protein